MERQLETVRKELLTRTADEYRDSSFDDVGRFLIRGRYDPSNKECYWTKSYVGAHDVFYRGFREGKGIWGTWEITHLARGGFHIWPRQAGEGGQEASSAEAEKPVDAIASEALTKTAVGSARTLDPAQSSSQACVPPRYAAVSINSASFAFRKDSTSAMALI